MKPDKHQDQLVLERPTAEEDRQQAVRQITEQRRPTHTVDPTDPFEAILEAYARDPERWDGLE